MERMDCPALVIGETVISSSNQRIFGSNVTLTCPARMEFATGVKRITTECLGGGRWSSPYIPHCQTVYCGPVPQIDNGLAIEVSNVTFGGEAQYQCYSGFEFASGKAMETIGCMGDDQCSASQCTPLPGVPNANPTVLNGGGMIYGSVIRFECESGYVRTGASVLCQSNGTWSGSVPSCSKIQCQTFPEIDNGWISNRTWTYFFGDETRAQCYRVWLQTERNDRHPVRIRRQIQQRAHLPGRG